MSPSMSIGSSNTSSADRYIVSDLKSAADSVPGSTINTVKQLKLEEMRGKGISIGEEQLIKMIERANKALEGKSTSFEFSIHEKTKSIMVKVLDKETGSVLREIPSEKILDMVAKMCEMTGLILDEKR
ncbi:hypothetical protein PAESOLCIP111_03512 [Paenibacillus solanacearum]|uniref:Flagellar protein FlaG n=1 Tax=Paenibacillus solanacearum TaxID=2048548 RepID=A0A916NJW0_9BACL|nr:flagellar protein FlaG [Paenibacillus solanacearum]CAG7633907.1 hypothetical protein PAESOLCIP111_03512 [Paenibacillus solanacearum]